MPGSTAVRTQRARRGDPAAWPVVGITTDLTVSGDIPRATCAMGYAEAVARAGGRPVLLPPVSEAVSAHVAICDAFVLTGGDDPATEPFGEPTHACAKLMHPRRQAYETALIAALEARPPDKPVLGICLGMQMMALAAGGRLNQHLPDDFPGHARHVKSIHAVVGQDGATTTGGRTDRLVTSGAVWSNHHQAVRDPGRLRVVARSDDGLIEAVADPARAFYLGVQWHPERTDEPALGLGLFERLVAAARRSHAAV